MALTAANCTSRSHYRCDGRLETYVCVAATCAFAIAFG